MTPNLNRFTTVKLDEQELTTSLAISAYTYAYINNKIASYAEAVLDFSYEDSLDSPTALQAAVIRHEKLKAQVEVLEELIREFTLPTQHESSDSLLPHSN